MDDLPSLSADVSALRARADALERKVEFLLKHLGLDFDVDTQADVEVAVADALRAGDTIKAITIYRQMTNSGLKESKEAVEAIATTLGIG